mmetsp:Transcript_3875/g.11448  ORF Transcript_3875/g.11448 Transcript_3875/m.11448 type:complete len:115 (+) Transcript_3875:937-1281(+)
MRGQNTYCGASNVGQRGGRETKARAGGRCRRRGDLTAPEPAADSDARQSLRPLSEAALRAACRRARAPRALVCEKKPHEANNKKPGGGATESRAPTPRTTESSPRGGAAHGLNP